MSIVLPLNWPFHGGIEYDHSGAERPRKRNVAASSHSTLNLPQFLPLTPFSDFTYFGLLLYIVLPTLALGLFGRANRR